MCFFVEYENKVIGYVHGEKYDTIYSKKSVNIFEFAVSAEKRRMGARHLLMSKVEDWAKLIGALGVGLNSGFSRIEAHAFYREIEYNLEKQQIRFMKML